MMPNRKKQPVHPSNQAIPLGLALVLDLIVGDPPNRYHPVAWMGSAIAWAQGHAPRQGRLAPFAYGVMIAVGGATLVAGLGHLLMRAIARLPAPWRWLAEAGVFKTTLSVQGLMKAARDIEATLHAEDLAEARWLVGWHLVSRDTSTLSTSQVTAATIESVAENLSDGVIGPLLAFSVGGLPAALAYRFINTLDAMWGYRDPDREWLGKAPARLDDLVNLVPARLTAALLIIAAALAGEDAHNAWQVWQQEAHKTASPNAGHPMSAMAGALGVELEKVGQYRLGAGQPSPEPEDIQRAVRLVQIVTALAAGMLIQYLYMEKIASASKMK